MNLNDAQVSIVERVVEAELGSVCYCPTGRRAGKTTLANALLRTNINALGIIRHHDGMDEYDSVIHRRLVVAGASLDGWTPDLVVVDEVHNSPYVERLTDIFPNSRIVHLFTPWEGMGMNFDYDDYAAALRQRPAQAENFPVYHQWVDPAERSWRPAQAPTGMSRRMDLLQHNAERLRDQEWTEGVIEETSVSTTVDDMRDLREFMERMTGIEKKKEKEWDEAENSA